MKLQPMKVLWGRKLNAPEWQEEILSTNEPAFERVKVLAAKDGFGFFRVSVDNGNAPDFSKTVNLS